MVSLDAGGQATSKAAVDHVSPSPRISFSSDFLDEEDFITISPRAHVREAQGEKDRARNADFEFLSGDSPASQMITADELFSEGKLLPFWQMQPSERLERISIAAKDGDEVKEEEDGEERGVNNKEEKRASWFVDDDPSPRPPTCTVLWKELLKLKKHNRASSLSPSSSSSSSSTSLADMEEGKDGAGHVEKHVKRIKKALERTRSASVRIRPMVNVPICTQGRSNALPPLFPLKKGILKR